MAIVICMNFEMNFWMPKDFSALIKVVIVCIRCATVILDVCSLVTIMTLIW